MKRRLLSLSIAALSIIGVSCEKNELSNGDGANHDLYGRGGGGGADASCAQPVGTQLIVEKNGQNNDNIAREGDVEVKVHPNTIDVKYKCDKGFVIKNVSVWVGPRSKAPVNNVGNPDFGQFQVREAYAADASTYVATIPKTMIQYTTSYVTDPMICIAHANVYKHNTESSYGEGPRFNNNHGKAMYIVLGACGWGLGEGN